MKGGIKYLWCKFDQNRLTIIEIKNKIRKFQFFAFFSKNIEFRVKMNRTKNVDLFIIYKLLI